MGKQLFVMGKAKQKGARVRYVSDSGSSFLVCGCGASVACSMVMGGLHTCDHSSKLAEQVVKLTLAADGKTWLPEHETEMMDALMEAEAVPKKKAQRIKDLDFVCADEPDSPAGRTAAPAAEEKSWVQCDSCQKWRSLPKFVSPESLPDSWQCEMMQEILSQSRLTCEQGQEPMDCEEEAEEVQEAGAEQSTERTAERDEHSRIEILPQIDEKVEPTATCKKSKKRQRSSFVMF